MQSGSISKKFLKSCSAENGLQFFSVSAKDIAMRNVSIRSVLIAGTAISGAMIWGVAEFLALQWSRVSEQLGLQISGRHRES